MNKSCENCLFKNQSDWKVTCSLDGKSRFIGEVCGEWENENIIIDTVCQKNEMSADQILDLKRQTVLFMRYAKEEK